VLAHEDMKGQWTNVTISHNAGIGYHGNFKGWPVMKECVISGNRGGGLKCEQGGASYRGRPEVADSDINENGGFDVWCDQPESYEFQNVFIGAGPGKRLLKHPSEVVPNLVDGRFPRAKGSGVVVIKDVRTEPVADAGASADVLELAKPFLPGK